MVVRQYNKKYISVFGHDSESVQISDIGEVEERHVKNVQREIQSVLVLEQYPNCKECRSKVIQIGWYMWSVYQV